MRFETKREIPFPLPFVLLLKSVMLTVHNCTYMILYEEEDEIINRGQLPCRR